MPTASKGFIAATSRKPAAAGTVPSRGTWTSDSDITVTRTFSVSSGMRLASSTYSRAPAAHGLEQRPVDEHVRGVALREDLRGVEVAEQPGGRQLGVALDRHVPDAGGRGEVAKRGRLARAGRALEQHVRPGAERGDDELDLAPA